MSFVDRYWEWRRRRALKASLRTPERTRELALVAEVLMESRGFSRRSGAREQALPVDEAAAAPVRPDDAPSKRPEKAETHKTALFPDRDASGRPIILAAIDGTRSSNEVGRYAVRLTEGLRGKLCVLSFINEAPASRMGVYRGLVLAELERDSEDMAEQTKELAEKSGIECEVRRALDPRPSWAIAAAAEEVGAYCVVIGSPDASMMDRRLDRAPGGVHEKLLRRARCPVLSVR